MLKERRVTIGLGRSSWVEADLFGDERGRVRIVDTGSASPFFLINSCLFAKKVARFTRKNCTCSYIWILDSLFRESIFRIHPCYVFCFFRTFVLYMYVNLCYIIFSTNQCSVCLMVYLLNHNCNKNKIYMWKWYLSFDFVVYLKLLKKELES